MTRREGGGGPGGEGQGGGVDTSATTMKVKQPQHLQHQIWKIQLQMFCPSLV